ncbi:hypothetical protein ABIE52_000281 [Rhodococcus sp. OAS809]
MDKDAEVAVKYQVDVQCAARYPESGAIAPWGSVLDRALKLCRLRRVECFGGLPIRPSARAAARPAAARCWMREAE